MTHQEFDRLMNSYFDGNIKEDELELLHAELGRNPDRKKLFDRLQSIYQKPNKIAGEENDAIFEKVALSNKIKPSSTDSEILEKAASGSLLSGVNAQASRNWKGYTEDNYGGRILAIFITVIIVVGLFLIDRQWAKSIEDKRKMGLLPPAEELAKSGGKGSVTHQGVNMAINENLRSKLFDGDLVRYVKSREEELYNAKYLSGDTIEEYFKKEKSLEELSESISKEEGTYIFSIQKNAFMLTIDMQTYPHSIILTI